jgi:small subunit ribosomal protein S20
MANIKSSKKDIKRIKIKMKRNRSRLSDIKTFTKKFVSAVEKKDAGAAAGLFKDVQSKIARAKGKGLFKANTAARKISALSKGLKSLEKA